MNMLDHTIKRSNRNAQTMLEFAPVFNVAVPFIDRHLKDRQDKVAIRTVKGDQVTYGELADRVNRCGNILLQLGARRGDRIMMVMNDCAEFFYVFWGAVKAGIIPVPVNTILRASDYRYLIEDSGCRVLIYSVDYADEIRPALEGLVMKPEHCIPVDNSKDSLQAMLASVLGNLEPAVTRETDECFWLYSSGSTGKPKAAVHLHRDMVVTSQLYGMETLGVCENDTCFSVAKLFFAYGLGNAMTFPLWVGASIVLDSARPTPASAFAVIKNFRPTLFFGVPTFYAALLRELEKMPADLSSLRLCVSAGEALPENILNRWHDITKLPILDGIGSTEALHIFITNRHNDIKVGSTGRLVTGYEAKIVDEAGNDVNHGEQGQLMIRGNSIAKYYWNNPEKTAETMINGWLKTGDTYYRDEEGYYYYCGRNDDMLKVGGIWCSPFEIEVTLSKHPKVLEAAVVAKEDESNLIKPAAFVVLKDPADEGDYLCDELLAHCKSTLAPYKYPRWIYFVEELPKTATGKIQRYKLRDHEAQ